jgi:signal transduction histidine kinase
MSASSALADRLRALRPPAFDVALALGCIAVAISVGRETHDRWLPFDTTAYLLTVLANAPVAFRRRAPVAVTIVCMAGWFASITAGYWPAVNVYGCMVGLYTVSATRPPRVALTVGAVGALEWIYAGLLADLITLPSVAAQAVVFTGVIWKFGDSSRQLEIRNRELAEVTAELRREQADRAYRAVADERMRIAAELHDVVAHHTSVISVQAGMAEYVFDTERQTARGALAVIAATSREAQQELRRMLSLLRRPVPEADGGSATAPGLARLHELVDRVRAAGVPAEVTVSGRRRQLPPGLDLCAYRVAQESLTNVLKHAGAAPTTVALEYRPDNFVLRVRDRGPRTAVRGVPAGSGHGLVGMRERAKLYGGTLTAGPLAEGGFEVVLTLPLP